MSKEWRDTKGSMKQPSKAGRFHPRANEIEQQPRFIEEMDDSPQERCLSVTPGYRALSHGTFSSGFAKCSRRSFSPDGFFLLLVDVL